MSQSPLTKKPRLETTTETKQQSNKNNDMLAGMLDVELQRYILTFLVHDPSGHMKTIFSSVRKGMMTTMKKCTLVCKTWHEMTNQLINQESSIQAVLSTAELIDIKTKMDRVDLAAVRPVFIQQVRDKWGPVSVGGPDGEIYEALGLFLVLSWREFRNICAACGIYVSQISRRQGRQDLHCFQKSLYR